MLEFRKTRTPLGTGVTVLEFSGSLDANFAEDFRGELARLDASAGGSYVVGFAGVRYVCSRVLGSLLGFSKEVRSAGGHVVLYAVPDGLRSVMEIVEYHAFFRFCADEEEALAVIDGRLPEEGPERRRSRTWIVVAVLAAVAAAAAVAALAGFLDGLF